MAVAYLCLGSNIGDKVGYLQQAVKLLTESGKITVVRTSALYETEPWGKPDQCWFLNAVIDGISNYVNSDIAFVIDTQLGDLLVNRLVIVRGEHCELHAVTSLSSRLHSNQCINDELIDG